VKNTKLFSFILIGGLFLGGCGGTDNADEVKEVTPAEDTEPASGDGEKMDDTGDSEKQDQLSAGLEETANSVEELSMSLKNASGDTQKLNEQGKMIEEKWDEIEKQIEENHPEDYENIEQILYPLIAEAKKDNPDIENLKSLSEDTKNKLKEFHDKINNQ
jgi:iron uptake system EfeUOB component EfeO/EfeM